MSRMQKILHSFELDDWVISLTSLVAVVIGILDFIGWLQLGTEQFLQMMVVGLGLLMATVVIQAKRQEIKLADLETEMGSIGQQLDVRMFDRAELAVAYMASRVCAAKDYIDQSSLSPPIPRWYSASQQFEQAIQSAALSNQVKVRYLANFADEPRLQRVRRILANPEVNRYFVKFYKPETLHVHVTNFIIFDGEEVILSVPGFGEQDAFFAIRNIEIVSAFAQYFNLLWSKATEFDRGTVIMQTISRGEAV